jgi:hypothetical protein
MPLICISGGIIRSGSTWAYNVCRALGQREAEQGGQTLSSGYPNMQPLDDLLASNGDHLPGPMVMKAHLLGPVALEWVNAGRAKAVYTLRDPRDCVASDMRFQGQGFETATARVMECFRNFATFPDSPHVLPIFYEEMMADTLDHVGQIAAHLGFDLDDETIRQIDQATGLGNSAKVCEELQHRPEGEIRRDGAHRVDPVTLLHDNHLGGGKIGRWKDELTPSQQQQLSRLFAPVLGILGYETERSESRAAG